MKLNLKNIKNLFVIFSLLTTTNILSQKLSIEYSTFLGGSSEDRAHAMAIDKQGNIYITAPILSNNFPVTPDALKKEFTGIYLAKISSNGDSLIYSTYIGTSGGANYAHGAAVDKEGNIYIAGNTTNSSFPTTENAFDRTFHGPADASHGDTFVMKLNPEGSQIIYSTFIGGSGMDICGKITVDAEGNAYVIGSTSSTDFPVTPGAFDTTFNGGGNDGRDDIFVAKLDPSGSNLLYCTYIGGSTTDQYGGNIYVDNDGSVYFTGTTASSNFPITSHAYDTSYNGGSGNRGAGDGVIVKLYPDGSDLEYSTFFGGSGDDFGSWLTLDEQGNIYVCGEADSSGFPVTTSSYSNGVKNGGYIAKLNPRISQLLYSAFWNTRIETFSITSNNKIIIAGSTESQNYPVTQDALHPSINGNSDIYISIIDPVSNTLLFSTYYGGKNHEIASSLLIKDNILYLSGNTVSSDFPISDNAYDKTFNGGTNRFGGDAFVSKFLIGDLSTSVEKTGSIELNKFLLFQNFPNPFNPSTTINYSLEKPSQVKLIIYDVTGQEIKILKNKFQNSGEYSLVWDAKDESNNTVSSGIYFYSLIADDNKIQKKMILLR